MSAPRASGAGLLRARVVPAFGVQFDDVAEAGRPQLPGGAWGGLSQDEATATGFDGAPGSGQQAERGPVMHDQAAGVDDDELIPLAVDQVGERSIERGRRLLVEDALDGD